MHSDTPHRPPTAPAVHRPVPIPPATTAPLVPAQPAAVPAVASIQLPDGRIITGYAFTPTQPEPVAAKPVVSRAAVNVALGGIGFAATCGGLMLLTGFLTALAAFIQQLVILAAVIFGGFIAAQVLGHRGGGTTVHIRKAVIKRSRFHG